MSDQKMGHEAANWERDEVMRVSKKILVICIFSVAAYGLAVFTYVF